MRTALLRFIGDLVRLLRRTEPWAIIIFNQARLGHKDTLDKTLRSMNAGQLKELIAAQDFLDDRLSKLLEQFQSEAMIHDGAVDASDFTPVERL